MIFSIFFFIEKNSINLVFMKKHSTLLVLAVIGIFMITSCGFQQRKYTHGHYLDCCKDPTSTVISPSLSAMTEIPCIDFLEGNQVSKPMMDDLSSSVLATDQDSDEKQNRSMGSEIVGDTTIKGSKGNRVDLPNQSETPAILEEHLKKSKKYANRYFGVTGLLFAAMVGLQVAFSQSSSIYSSSLYLSMIVAYVLMLFTFLYFRSLWKKPYQSLSDGLRSYRKFNEQEKWYKAFDNRVFSLHFLIVLSVLMTVFAFFILITPLYGGY